jgi:sulfite reductase (NADPH) flavoprotein alpha-component
VYVQQRLREAGDEVWRLLEAGAHFYVCGDAGSMAGAVEVALLDIISAHLGEQQQQQQGDAKAAAAAYLEQLSSSGRYQRDVWFS